MKRRTFLGAVAGIGGTGALTLSTGAFSYVRADRSMTVDVVDDPNAYLALDEVGDGGRSVNDGGKLRFRIPGAFEGSVSSGEGVGSNSVYRFDSDANDDQDGLFAVQNQGTQSVTVFGSDSSSTELSVAMFDVETDELLTEDDPSKALDPGASLLCGIQIDTHGVDVRDRAYQATLTIHGEKTS